MSTRKFNLMCIIALIVVAILAMIMVESSPRDLGTGIQPDLASGDIDTNGAFNVQPLGLGLSLAIVVNIGLMTVGLVILFKDDAPGRYRTR